MIKVNVPVNTQTTEYGVKFYYTKPKSKKEQRKYENGLTACVITDSNKLIIAKGDSVCYLTDIFDKKVGREHSLAKALLQLPKDLRKYFWSAYFQICAKDKYELFLKTLEV